MPVRLKAGSSTRLETNDPLWSSSSPVLSDSSSSSSSSSPSPSAPVFGYDDDDEGFSQPAPIKTRDEVLLEVGLMCACFYSVFWNSCVFVVEEHGRKIMSQRQLIVCMNHRWTVTSCLPYIIYLLWRYIECSHFSKTTGPNCCTLQFCSDSIQSSRCVLILWYSYWLTDLSFSTNSK